MQQLISPKLRKSISEYIFKANKQTAELFHPYLIFVAHKNHNTLKNNFLRVAASDTPCMEYGALLEASMGLPIK